MRRDFLYRKIKRSFELKKICFTFITILLSTCALALDPATRAASKMQGIMFGTLGTSLCAILIGATFIMAKAGKISWDRFVFIGFCTAGFLGAPSIVSTIQGWVN